MINRPSEIVLFQEEVINHIKFALQMEAINPDSPELAVNLSIYEDGIEIKFGDNSYQTGLIPKELVPSLMKSMVEDEVIRSQIDLNIIAFSAAKLLEVLPDTMLPFPITIGLNLNSVENFTDEVIQIQKLLQTKLPITDLQLVYKQQKTILPNTFLPLIDSINQHPYIVELGFNGFTPTNQPEEKFLNDEDIKFFNLLFRSPKLRNLTFTNTALPWQNLSESLAQSIIKNLILDAETLFSQPEGINTLIEAIKKNCHLKFLGINWLEASLLENEIKMLADAIRSNSKSKLEKIEFEDSVPEMIEEAIKFSNERRKTQIEALREAQKTVRLVGKELFLLNKKKENIMQVLPHDIIRTIISFNAGFTLFQTMIKDLELSNETPVVKKHKLG